MSNILYGNLYHDVLLEPVQQNPQLDNLYIVSGYATAAMAFRHMTESPDVKINLIYGMAAYNGISVSNHEGFCRWSDHDFSERFQCSYLYRGEPVHSKLYLWCEGDAPQIAFLGSANYTQAGMCSRERREMLIACPATQAFDYFQSLVGDTIQCTHGEVAEHLRLYMDEKQKSATQATGQSPIMNYSGLEHVNISFLIRGGGVGTASGLNWGQRQKRDHNEAYIRLPSSISRTDFFPPLATHFTVFTDDAKTLVCSRAQADAKAIHTPQDNSLIGVYFRNRLGVGSGSPVTLADLQVYGRTDVDFYKIDDETYYLDFSV